MSDGAPGLPGRWFPPKSLPNLPESLPAAVRKRGAFLPSPLPSEVVLRNETWTAAAEAQESLGRLDVRVQEFPHADAWARQVRVREVHASAQLDEVMVPWREALVITAARQPAVQAKHPFVGYLDSSDRVFEAAAASRALTAEFLSQISAVTAGVPDGGADQWRTMPGWLGGMAPGEAVHLLAPPGPELMVATEQWCMWKHSQRSLPAAVKVAMMTPQFMLISPFAVSGHLARLAIHHELVISKVLSAPVVPLSQWLSRKRAQLLRLIGEVIDHGDFNDLVSFFATGIRVACKRETLLIEQAQIKKAELSAALIAKMTSMATLVQALSVTPMLTLAQIAEICEISPSQAANLARQLLDDNIIMTMDSESYQGQPDDHSRRKFIYLPEMIRGPLDTFPRTDP